jgi:surfeit locus 1 family protein
MNTTAATNQRLRWDADWRTTVFVAVFLPLLVGFGFWQQERALEKQAIAAEWTARQQEAPRSLLSLADSPAELAYRRVLLRGYFIEQRNFLLDNRIYQGRYGVEVITPLRLEGADTVVLVNRGWIEADAGRRTLPELPQDLALQSLAGTVYVPPGEAYTLGQISDNEDWPRLVQALDVPALGVMLDVELFPYTVRLEPGSAAGFTIEWPLMNTSPEKHRAYAVQWFSMAAALLMIYLWRSTNLATLWRHRRSKREHSG